MKGIVVQLLITAVLLLTLPFVVVHRQPQPSSDANDVSVMISDGKTQPMDVHEYTRYATMNLLPPDAPDEAIKAVAAAQFTLAQYQTQIGQSAISPAGDFPSSYNEDYWRNTWGEDVYQTHAGRFAEAVETATHTPMRYNGQPIMALLHTANHGKTENAQDVWGTVLPYLVSVDSPPDAVDPARLTTLTFSQEEAAPIIQQLCSDTTAPPKEEWFQNASHTPGGTVLQMSFGTQTVSGESIAKAFSLPSRVFRVSTQEGQVIFTVQGNGHFVGMSLCGCIGMAKEGKTWKEILSHYYTGVTLP